MRHRARGTLRYSFAALTKAFGRQTHSLGQIVDSYNGFLPPERERKGHAVAKALAAGRIARPAACMLCGDPAARLELHSEDYSQPYTFTPPAAYWLCRACHRNNLHKRFNESERWEAFLAHVRRGGYASELRDPNIRRQLRGYRDASQRGEAAELPSLRDAPAGPRWWEHLTLDPRSKNDRSLVPKPIRPDQNE